MPRLAEFPLETGAAAPAGGSGCGDIMAGLLAFFQAFPNPGCFAPSFSKQIFGRFVGFQGVASLKAPKRCLSKFFCGSPPPFSRIPDAAAPAFRRLAPEGGRGRSRASVLQRGRRTVHGSG